MRIHFAPVLTVLPLLAGCYAVPKDMDFTTELPGNYQFIADCAFLKFRRTGEWSKTDYPSMNRAELEMRKDNNAVARIDIIGEGVNKTRIESYHPKLIGNADYWPDVHRPIFEQCSRDAIAGASEVKAQQ